MVQENIKSKFEVFQSYCACEEYSDRGGNGIPGMFNSGVANDSIQFMFSLTMLQLVDIYNFLGAIELLYIAYSLGIEKLFLLFVFMPGQGTESLEIKEIDWIENFILEMKKRELEEKILDKINKLHSDNKKIFFQDREKWTKDIWNNVETDEKMVCFSRRLGMYICDKEVTLIPQQVPQEVLK